jgi:glutamyl-tRNA synthetase
MTNIVTRFAPSPTGYLHVGNARTAIINYLYAKKHNGKFILRIDDTDTIRNKDEYKTAIIQDLKWLGLDWDDTFNQSSRTEKYESAKQQLISNGRLYACYETSEELEIKRKIQLSRGHPPIYDRAGLRLTEVEKQAYLAAGRKPHYRFLINDSLISWQDMVKGQVSYQGKNLGDPVIIREDGSMTYMLCSTIDDIDYNITHVIRGEDHVSNTAVQSQMFEAFSAKPPVFAHLSLVKAKDEKISKRDGGFEIASLRDQQNLESMSINSFFSTIGSSNPVTFCKKMSELIDKFDITSYSKSPTTYVPEELEQINQKLVISYEFSDVKARLEQLGIKDVGEQFWLAVRPNISKIIEIKDWWEICHNPSKVEGLDKEFLKIAADNLPTQVNDQTWKEWTSILSSKTGKRGKELFMPLRLSLTGRSSGPELKDLLPLLSREEILSRLSL